MGSLDFARDDYLLAAIPVAKHPALFAGSRSTPLAQHVRGHAGQVSPLNQAEFTGATHDMGIAPHEPLVRCS